MLYCCNGNARGNAARAGGIIPGGRGLDNKDSNVQARSKDLAKRRVGFDLRGLKVPPPQRKTKKSVGIWPILYF